MNTNNNLWGPDRSTFTMDSPATYPVFNSIIDNPTIGDERSFVRIGEITPKSTELGQSIIVQAGKQYLVYIYFHNDASAIFNDSAHKQVGVALNVRLTVDYSDEITPDKEGVVLAEIYSSNAKPETIWSSVVLQSNNEVHLRYVDGTAKIHCDWKANKTLLSSRLFSSEGILIGLNKLDGVIPGCEEYHGVITFILQAE